MIALGPKAENDDWQLNSLLAQHKSDRKVSELLLWQQTQPNGELMPGKMFNNSSNITLCIYKSRSLTRSL